MSTKAVEIDATMTHDDKIEITSLNENILEKIFMYLILGDLLSIKDTSKLFQPIVDRVFRSKYGKSKMIYRANHGSHHKPTVWQDDDIYVDDLTHCLRILRCFGHEMTQLDVNYVKSSETKCAEIDKYLNRYCQALTDITFRHAGKYTLCRMTNPFKQIENITFEDSYLSGKLVDFNKWFPQMRALELKCYVYFENGRVLERHFPRLETLIINGKMNNVQWSNIINTLQANPQLRRLGVCDYFGMKFLQNANRSLHFLEHLTLCKWAEQEFNYDGDYVHFKNVRHLTVDFSRLCFVPQMPLRFDQIEELTVDSVYLCRFNDNFIDFMRRHPRIRKLFIKWQNFSFQRQITNRNNAIFKEKLAKVSSYLQDIDLGACSFTLHEAISFLSECKSLKRFSLSLDNSTDYDALHDHLGKDWNKITDNPNSIRFECST